MRPNFPSQIAQRPLRRCEDIGNWCALFSPVGLAWVVIGARVLLAVALRAYVKRAVGIVVTGQIARRIRTPVAEPDSHVPPPGARQRIASPLRLRLIVLAGIVDILSPAIGFPINSETRKIEADGSIVRR